MVSWHTNRTTFSIGTVTVTLDVVDDNGQPTGTSKNFDPGSYTLLILVDTDACSSIMGGELCDIQSVDIDGDTNVTFNDADFISLVSEAICVTSSSVPDGGGLYGFWLLTGSPIVSDPSNAIDYLFNEQVLHQPD